MIFKKKRSNYQAYSHWASSGADIKDLKAQPKKKYATE